MAVSNAAGADPSRGPLTSQETATEASPDAEVAFSLRDQALAALDAGEPALALDLVSKGLTVLAEADLGGLDEAALRLTLAETETELGQFDAAAASAAKAAELLGDDCPPADANDSEARLDWLRLWCQAQERLAVAERMAANFDAASLRLRKVLDRASSAFGEASHPVLSAANELGMTGKYSGDFAAADAAYRRALAGLDARPEPDPLTRAALLHNLGGLAHARGDAAAGIPPAEEGVAIRISMLGAGHPAVAGDLNALGALYHLAERYPQAADAYYRALAIFETTFGPDHFEVAMTCANLAVLYSDQADFGEAETAGRRSLVILEQALGPADVEVGLTLLNLAAAVKGQGRRGEAAELTGRAAAILQARLPAGHSYVLAATTALDALAGPE